MDASTLADLADLYLLRCKVEGKSAGTVRAYRETVTRFLRQLPSDVADGITRRVAIELARARGYEIVERRIMPEEMAGFTECFITGTAAEVTPVSEIGPYRFTPGEITKTVMDDYTAVVQPQADMPARAATQAGAEASATATA